MIELDIVIPAYKNKNELISLINSIKLQKNILINKIIVPLTVPTKNDLEIEDFCKLNNIEIMTICIRDFSHSSVREKAIRNLCKSKIVVLLTQDVKFQSNDAIYNLVKDINEEIVYSFGRQICKKRCIEKYIREFNYPKKSYISDKTHIDKYQIKTFYASDSFSALNRDVFLKLDGYDRLSLTTNEDMYYMYKIITNDYKAKYCADAIVEHYHKYTLRKLYKRYYETGRFFKQVKIFDQFKKIDSGKELAFYVLKRSIKRFDILSLFSWLPNMSARYFGMKRGNK